MSKYSGVPAIFEGNPYEMHRYQRHQLGAKMFAANGDIYRYTWGGATTATDFIAGYLYVAQANVYHHINVYVGATEVVGAESIELALGATAAAAHIYDEGWLIFVDTEPQGQTYQVTAHDASTAGSEDITVWIDQALKTACVEDSSEASLIRNAWNQPLAGTADTEVAAGVAMMPWDFSVYEQYGWLKTRGMCGVFGETTIADGVQVCVSDSVTGAIGACTSITERVIGLTQDAPATGEFHPVYLFID